MKLTGKCKTDFEFWFSNESKLEYTPITVWYNVENHYPYEVDFYALDSSYQYGVYVDFFDSVRIHIGNDSPNEFWVLTDNELFFDIKENDYIIFEKLENRQKAIKQANKIYNKL